MNNVMKSRSKKPMVDYLELDENTYIEKDIIKTRISENNNHPQFVPWDEFWDNINNRMSKIKEYNETHN